MAGTEHCAVQGEVLGAGAEVLVALGGTGDDLLADQHVPLSRVSVLATVTVFGPGTVTVVPVITGVSPAVGRVVGRRPEITLGRGADRR